MAIFIPENFVIPLELLQPAFSLKPLTPDFLQKDFDAVLESQERLRRFSNGKWPHPGFTVAENAGDLQRHAAEFAAREAFAYTVITPDAAQVLGCLYIYPGPTDDAVVVFWLRDSALHLGPLFSAHVKEWIASAWPFETVRFVEEIGQKGSKQLAQQAPDQMLGLGQAY